MATIRLCGSLRSCTTQTLELNNTGTENTEISRPTDVFFCSLAVAQLAAAAAGSASDASQYASTGELNKLLHVSVMELAEVMHSDARIKLHYEYMEPWTFQSEDSEASQPSTLNPSS